MAAPSSRIPSYRLHRPSGQAVVTLDNRDHYLGPHGSPQSQEAYNRVVAQWLRGGRHVPSASGSQGLSINELMLAYVVYAESYYRKPDGSQSRELVNIKTALRPLKALFGFTMADEFGPRSLKAIQQSLVTEGHLCRSVINKRISHIKRMFAWACSEELVPPTVYHSLLCVKGLRRGRCAAKETDPVEPVPDAHVDAVLPYLPTTVRTMVELQRLTGMRSGELVQMRACDIDMAGEVWLYRPQSHKSAHLGRSRVIPLGPRSQELIRPFLTLSPQAVLFRPEQAQKERTQTMRANRKTKVQPSQICRAKANPEKTPGQAYTTTTYYRAVRYGMEAAHRAGKLAEAEFWHPHQLRHSAAQRVQREAGLEAARAFLGHAKPDMTAHYASIDQTLAAEVAKKTA